MGLRGWSTAANCPQPQRERLLKLLGCDVPCAVVCTLQPHIFSPASHSVSGSSRDPACCPWERKPYHEDGVSSAVLDEFSQCSLRPDRGARGPHAGPTERRGPAAPRLAPLARGQGLGGNAGRSPFFNQQKCCSTACTCTYRFSVRLSVFVYLNTHVCLFVSLHHFLF